MAYVDESSKVGVVIEVNAETDFVAKNQIFIDFVTLCAKTVAEQNPADADALLALVPAGEKDDIATLLRDKILTIGENIKIRRFVRYEGNLATYIHGNGRIGVMVRFCVDDAVAATEGFKVMAKDIAMQIAAANPLYLDSDSVPAEVLEHREENPDRAGHQRRASRPPSPKRLLPVKLGNTTRKTAWSTSRLSKTPILTLPNTSTTSPRNWVRRSKFASSAAPEKGEGLQKREDNFADEVAEHDGLIPSPSV